jgi:type IV secretion system protein VirB11
LATIHANSAVEALSRLEDLIGEVTQRVPYRAIAQAINLVVFIERTPSGRQVRSVTRVVGREGETYRLEEVTGSTSRGGAGLGLSSLLA